MKQITIPYDPKGMIPGKREVKFTRKVYTDSISQKRIVPDSSGSRQIKLFVYSIFPSLFVQLHSPRTPTAAYPILEQLKSKGKSPRPTSTGWMRLRVLRLSLASTTHFSRPTAPTVLTGKKRWVGR